MTEQAFVVIPAAGVGMRFNHCQAGGPKQSTLPKQYQALNGIPVLAHTLNCFQNLAWVNHIIVVLHESDRYFQSFFPVLPDKVNTVIGGDTRGQSVFNGLTALQTKANGNDWVLVHDAVRPCLTQSDLARLRANVLNHEVGGILAEPMCATVKKSRNGKDIEHTVNREALFQALTPQMFRFDILLTSLKYALEKGLNMTDESQAVEYLGYSPLLVQARDPNIKITTANDLQLAAYLQAEQKEEILE